MELRKAGYRWEVAWSVEHGSKTGMVHVHLLQHGSFVPQETLQNLWGSIVDIRRIKSQGVAEYALKEALKVVDYTTKESRRDLDGHLERNGGRVVHLSRRYLRGFTSDEVWKAIQLARNGGEVHNWVRIPNWASLDDVASNFQQPCRVWPVE